MAGLVYTAILLFLTTLGPFSSSVSADTQIPIPKPVLDSIFLLRSRTNGTCATGLLLSDGLLVTNTHVIRTVCPTGECPDIELLQATGLAQAPSTSIGISAARLEVEIPSIDVSFLRITSPQVIRGYDISVAAPSPGAKVVAIGFPRCQVLTASHGTIGSIDSIRVSSSTRGSHGSSGSPLFDEQFRLVGIVGESDSIFGGLLSMVSDYRFENIATRADLVMSFRGQSEAQALEKQVDVLLSHYKDSVRNLTGLSRMRSAVSFTSAIEGVRDQLLFGSPGAPALSSFAALGQHVEYLARLQPPDRSGLSLKLSNLVLAYNLEMNGPYQQFFVPVRTEALFSAIERKDLPKELVSEWRDLVIHSASSSYPGLQLYGLIVAVQVFLILGAILTLVAWSMGYVFAGLPGSLPKRLAWMFGAAILWPIPVIVTWWKRRKRQ